MSLLNQELLEETLNACIGTLPRGYSVHGTSSASFTTRVSHSLQTGFDDLDAIFVSEMNNVLLVTLRWELTPLSC